MQSKCATPGGALASQETPPHCKPGAAQEGTPNPLGSHPLGSHPVCHPAVSQNILTREMQIARVAHALTVRLE
eukprot:CAMPEP_0179170554 /NCGR_PEP_ID=MMETSP0796-20121207/84031_1 /TAXON_ID=73915 /ORGANISM="Pyrodinium bahamense, Strain pbaha01" /LENGTH=72 /DNA_ID=CAMNT_0020873551 /DNA_START=730 /DNA_END=945 /DNA_ORIENTATION=+